MNRAVVAFHLNLLQDVFVIRPLALLAAQTDCDVVFLLSPRFLQLDEGDLWVAALTKLAGDVGASIIRYETLFDAVRLLTGRRGLCIAGSESDVRAHEGSHALFRVLPSSFRTVTLQHGFECLGFLHNAKHTAVHGGTVRFAADVVVGWFSMSRLHDLAPSERGKLYVAGPPSLISLSTEAPRVGDFMPYQGLMCENTHSVRFGSAHVRDQFLDDTRALANRVEAIGKRLHFRPHPAGGFLKRTVFATSTPVALQTAPLYELDLGQYSFVISAPSTVLFDFMLAKVPVGVWGHPDLDLGNFASLANVRGETACWAFANASVTDRERLLDRQGAFIMGFGIPDNVGDRYRALLALASA